MSQAFSLRALQLDLARQMEHPQTIRRMIDFAAENGYNALVFYLEDRIRTAAYPYSPPEQSYSPENMSELVVYAESRGLIIIPVVSTLGHTERFLRHPQMRHLAEARTGMPPRIGDGFNVVCPTLDESYAFWRQYLAEIAAIFPAPYFHLGGDEVWNLALCPLCRERLARGESIDAMYADHICRIDEILRGLGKQAMMWDDMFEEFPAALDLIPQDIIQCVWQYDASVQQTRSHFGRRFSDHRLAEYDRRGIRYLIAPVAWNLLNTESFTWYSEQFHPLGALMTRWDGRMFEDEALICASAGRLWAAPDNDGKSALQQATHWLLGQTPGELLHQTLCSLSRTSIWPLVSDVRQLLDHPVSAYGTEFRENRRLCEQILESAGSQFSTRFGQEYRQALLLRLRQERLQFSLKDLLFSFLRARVCAQPIAAAELYSLQIIQQELLRLQEEWKALWDLNHGSVPVGSGSTPQSKVEKLSASLTEILDRAKRDNSAWAFFRVGYSLPDYYGWPRVRWCVQYEESAEWVEIYDANPKHSFRDYSDCPFISVGTMVEHSGTPQRLRLEYRGYCGIGVLYLKFFANGRMYLPVAIASSSGYVRGPENLLRDDTNWCWLGISSQEGAFVDAAVTHPMAKVELLLRDAGPALFP